MPVDIAVIIPHFQRTHGVLARTLAALFAQDASENLTVIIVDDESPAPAAAELAGLDDTARAAITLIKRKNGGPAAAKNTGLAAIPDDIQYIALLDCDDIWSPKHISRGLAAMRLGYDFFFSDHRREGAEQSHFEDLGILRRNHQLIDPENDLYQWKSDLFDTCLRKTLIGLSTVVFRRSAFPGLRFVEDVGISDDMIFALHVSRKTSKIAFTFSEDVLYTWGDNASVVTDWRSNKALRLSVSLSTFYHRALKDYSVSDAQYEFLTKNIRKTRESFSTTMIAMLLKRQKIDKTYVLQFLRNDRGLILEFPRSAFRMLRKRL